MDRAIWARKPEVKTTASMYLVVHSTCNEKERFNEPVRGVSEGRMICRGKGEDIGRLKIHKIGPIGVSTLH